MVELKISTIGYYCNDWPVLKITSNNVTIFQEPIVNKQKIIINLDPSPNELNEITIGMVGKCFGKKGVWDTKIHKSEIVEDKFIKIRSVFLDDVSVKDLLPMNPYTVILTDEQTVKNTPAKIVSDGIIGFNGYFCIPYKLPLYNYLINAKFKTNNGSVKSCFSNHENFFNYTPQLRLIKEINNLINEIKNSEDISSKHT